MVEEYAVQSESLRQGELHTTTGTGSKQVGIAFFKTPSCGRTCMTMCQFFSMWEEGIKGPTALTR